MCQKRKFKFKDYKNCLRTTQFQNKINHPEKNKVNTQRLREKYKKFTNNNKLILKTKERFKSKRHNVFTEEVNDDNDDKKIQSIDSVGTYAYGTSKDLICEKEKKLNITI